MNIIIIDLFFLIFINKLLKIKIFLKIQISNYNLYKFKFISIKISHFLSKYCDFNNHYLDIFIKKLRFN